MFEILSSKNWEFAKTSILLLKPLEYGSEIGKEKKKK